MSQGVRVRFAFAWAVAPCLLCWTAATQCQVPLSAPVSVPVSVPPLQVVGDAVPEALSGTPGDPVRGRAIVANRQLGLCLLCHTAPIQEERMQGNLAPDLVGAGKRWSVGQLRLRVADARVLNPLTIMPSYHRVPASARVARAWASAPLLDAQQVEDVVAFLHTLRD